MKKLVFASVLALACIGYVATPMLRAQDSITIKDPKEYNDFQLANSQTDDKTKAGQLEDFLNHYPQSVVKSMVLESLIDSYQKLNDPDKTLSAADRLLKVDPNNMKAIFISVYIKKNQCAKTSDAQVCDDAGALALKGLTVAKPASVSDDEWKKQTGGAYPVFHSAIALDDLLSKKDVKAGIAEYRNELMLYSANQSTTGLGLWDTLQLAEAYIKQEPADAKAARDAAAKVKAATDPGAKAAAQQAAKDAKDADNNDLTQAVWFYARAWNFAPAQLKAPIETKMKYYFTKYHGNTDGLDAVKTDAANTLFPPNNFQPTPAKTPADIVHDLMANTTDLNGLALSDKEYILANGTQEDADKLWAIMKGKATPVPGEVISATASQIQLAVSPDAKGATPKYADFIVNLKTSLADKDIPKAGMVYAIQPAAELDATYDSYTQVAATDTKEASAQIVLNDGTIVPEKKKTVPVHHPVAKPSAAHKPAAH